MGTVGAMTWALKTIDLKQRARKRSGDDTEALVEQLNEALRLRGIAYLRKIPTPFKEIGRCAKGIIVVPRKKSGVDYQGMLLDGSGNAVYVEAKRVTTRRFHLSRVEPHQKKELDLVLDHAGIAVLLLVYGPLKAVYAIPWVIARGTTVSLGPEELAPYLVPTGSHYLSRWVR